MIEKLPELVLAKVFKHLQIFDQLAIRPVCKSWKAVVENWLLSRRELILFHKTPGLPLVWFHDGSPVNLTNSLISNDQFKSSQFFWQIFQNIRRLYIVCYLEFLYEPNHLDFVNRFTQLEHLQVDVLQYDAVKNRNYWSRAVQSQINLNLPNLKSFCCFNENCGMKIHRLNCPKLEQFTAPCHFQISERKCSSFRESLKFLKVKDYQFQPGFSFPNLETFLFQMVTCMTRNGLKIALHPKLKEIQIYLDFYKGKHIGNYDSIAFQQINQLFKEKKLEGRELNFFCFGLRCTLDTAEEIYRLPRTYLTRLEVELFLKNSEDFKLEHAKRNLIYDPILDNYLAVFDELHLERLARSIQVVEFPQILSNDSALTAKYQALFRYVRILYLSEQFQDQRDLDRLPELFPHVLEIQEGSLASLIRNGDPYEGCANPAAFPHLFQKIFNFDFLARFPALTRLETDRWTLSRAEFERILKDCRFLREMKFSRRQLVGSLEVPIRTEFFVYTISLRGAIKVNVLGRTFKLAQEHVFDFVPFRESIDETFGSLQELVGYLNLNEYFF